MAQKYLLDETIPLLEALSRRQRWTDATTIDEAIRRLAESLGVTIEVPAMKQARLDEANDADE